MKSSLSLVALSFFKEKRIDYYYNDDVIIFPCFYCSFETKMNAYETKWHCLKCDRHGNLKTLIEYLNRNCAPDNKVYNPNLEIRLLSSRLIRLSGKYQISDPKLAEALNDIEIKMRDVWKYVSGNPIEKGTLGV